MTHKHATQSLKRKKTQNIFFIISSSVTRRQDIQHSDTLPNDIQQNMVCLPYLVVCSYSLPTVLINAIFLLVIRPNDMMNVIMFNVILLYVIFLYGISLCQCTLCHFVECHYAECHYAECRYAECHFTVSHFAECHYAECYYTEWRMSSC
jgi:hypothetical protein